MCYKTRTSSRATDRTQSATRLTVDAVGIACRGNSKPRTVEKSLGTLATEIKNPDGGSMLWVFALPEK